MWIQLDQTEVERLASTARASKELGIAKKLEHSLTIATEKAHFIDAYRSAANKIYCREGELEFDDDAVVSAGEDNGAYVMGWRWVEACDLARVGEEQSGNTKH